MYILDPIRPQDTAALRALYDSAFPPEERVLSFDEMLAAPQNDALAIRTAPGGEPLGLVLGVRHGALVLLAYFAVFAPYRNSGIGTAVLPLMREYYKGLSVFGEVEPDDPSRPGNALRKRRIEFYLRNGAVRSGVFVNLYGADYELLYTDRPVTFDEYYALYRALLPAARHGDLPVEIAPIPGSEAGLTHRGHPEA